MQIDIQADKVIEVIRILFNSLSEEQKIIVLKKLEPEVKKSRIQYKKNIIAARHATEEWSLNEETFDEVNKTLLKGEKVNWEKFKKLS